MDDSFDEQGSRAQQAPKSFFANLLILASLISWLASLIQWAEEEQGEAGIYMDRLGGE